jgi:NADH dehydrogenase
MKRIVVVGAGYAGVLTAKKLAKRIKKLKKQNDFELTIIDKHPFHTMLTELHEVAAQRVEEESVKINLDRVFAGRKVNVVTDCISSVDYDSRKIHGEKSDYDYDYMVMATGSKPTYFGTKGAEEHSFTLWSYEDSVKLREHIMHMFREAESELDADKRRELLTFYVVGAGFTGVEMAGELAELIPHLCERFEIDPSEVHINECDLLDRACTVLPEKQSNKVQRRLAKMNVNLMLKTGTQEVGEDYIIYAGAEKKPVTDKTRTVIWTAGIEGSDLAEGSKDLEQKGRGRLVTDAFLRSTTHPEVYIAGDNIFYVPEGEKSPVPQMVENAEASADTIVHNLLSAAAGDGEPEKYKPSFHGVMVSVGGRWGTAHVGFPSFMFGLPSILAMFSKHAVNLLYFIKVLGLNKIFTYLNHEIFSVRDRRAFTGGHFSNASATFFTVPLRMYLGFYWIYEGVNKILDGWFKGPSLTDYFKSADQFYDNIINGVASVSSATGASGGGAGASAGTVLINWRILGGFAHMLLVKGSDVAFQLKFGVMDWFLNTFVMHSTPMQNFMQYFIILSELLIGCALLGGLFTTLAGAYSLVLQFMFITTTGIYLSTWWMIFASIAVMFGAGRVMSLDYYVMPFLKKHWKKVKFVRKWYLYND